MIQSQNHKLQSCLLHCYELPNRIFWFKLNVGVVTDMNALKMLHVVC